MENEYLIERPFKSSSGKGWKDMTKAELRKMFSKADFEAVERIEKIKVSKEWHHPRNTLEVAKFVRLNIEDLVEKKFDRSQILCRHEWNEIKKQLSKKIR